MATQVISGNRGKLLQHSKKNCEPRFFELEKNTESDLINTHTIRMGDGEWDLMQ